MGKFFLRFFLIVLIVAVSAIIFLSFFGIETNKFDALIKEKANQVNQNVKLEFNKTKIHLNLKEANLVVKLKEPRVVIRNKYAFYRTEFLDIRIGKTFIRQSHFLRFFLR